MNIVSNDIDLGYSHERGYFDIELDGAGLQGVQNLRTAIVISLFSDHRSGPDDRVPNSRGWVGDALNTGDETNIGSLLWLLHPEKTTDDLLPRIEGYAQRALRWIVRRGIARSVNVQAEYVDRVNGVVSIRIELERPRGNVSQKFEYVWNQIEEK